MLLGDKLSKLRKENNYTQEQLADMLEVSRQAISKWENGTAYSETDKLLKISEIFDCSLDYLLKDKGSRDKEVSGAISPSGKIFISSFDNKSIVNCQKVTCTTVAVALKDEPKYILYGIDSISFWGEHNTLLGWYESLDKIEQEIKEIMEAISRGEPSYKLKYAADIEYTGIFKQPKLKKHI